MLLRPLTLAEAAMSNNALPDLDLIPAETADHMAGMPSGWARARAAAGGLGGRVIDQRVFVRRSSVLAFLETAPRPPARRQPTHLRLVVDNTTDADRTGSFRK